MSQIEKSNLTVAVVGSGISGLGAAWLLSKKYDVHLFEADDRLGGHAHTVTVKEESGPVPIDTGFLVYNELTYPNLTAFFKELNVETVDSNMSLSVQVPHKNLEWSGTSLNSVFGQRKNLLKLSFYKMLLEILRFGREAEANVTLSRQHSWSLNDLLKNRNYSENFKSDYLLPIGAAIWSTPETKMFDFPAETFLIFFINHKLLQVNDRPVWRTVKNGSIQYVQKAAAMVSKISLNTRVQEVERKNGKVVLRTTQGIFEFDKVVLATHAPITHQILKNQTQEENRILGAIAYEANRTLLHTDQDVMPNSKVCWASWNVNGVMSKEKTTKVSLSYYLNLLQPLKTTKNYFVTLNPARDPQNILREFKYSHPQFDQKAIDAQKELPSIQGHGEVYFAGAWSRYGFHEDGLLSAVNVARRMHVTAPWNES